MPTVRTPACVRDETSKTPAPSVSKAPAAPNAGAVLATPNTPLSPLAPTSLERFLSCQEYGSQLPRPNFELGAWPQTWARWEQEAPAAVAGLKRDWFVGDPALGMDRREYVNVNYGFLPPFRRLVLDSTERYEIVRNEKGILSKALLEGMLGHCRMSMDQYLGFPLEAPEDFPGLRARLNPARPERAPKDLQARLPRWKTRTYPLVLGTNCAANGFYWRAREFMGTENLSYAWYDHPELLHQVMEHYADFIIETSRPILEQIQVDYFCLNEDFAMKGGPLLSPATFKTFIFPHLKRLVEFFRAKGTRYLVVDSDGDPGLLVPLLLDAGIDTLWPLERASHVDPLVWRRRFGRGLRLWGGVDKRVLSQGRAAIRAHLREFIPLIEEGGFIPHVDHTVPPDVSWDDFLYYMEKKRDLLHGDFGRLD